MNTAEVLLPTIHRVRGQDVILDSDLANLYQVTPKALNQAIRRNAAKFPRDFIFQVTREEVANLRSQTVTLSLHPLYNQLDNSFTLETNGHGRHRKFLPFVFTEHGAIMAATVLRSKRAVAMSVYVVRAFVRMRQELASRADLLKRIEGIDQHLLEHDIALQEIHEGLQPLIDPTKSKIGFHQGNR